MRLLFLLVVLISTACGSDSSGNSNKSDECSSCLKGCASVCAGDSECIRYVACTKDCGWDDESCFDVCEVMYPSSFQSAVDDCQEVACEETCEVKITRGDYCATVSKMCDNAVACTGGDGFNLSVELDGQITEYSDYDECLADFLAGVDCNATTIIEECTDEVAGELDCIGDTYQVPAICLSDEPNIEANFCKGAQTLCDNAFECSGFNQPFDVDFGGQVNTYQNVNECRNALIGDEDCATAQLDLACEQAINRNDTCSGIYLLPQECLPG